MFEKKDIVNVLEDESLTSYFIPRKNTRKTKTLMDQTHLITDNLYY